MKVHYTATADPDDLKRLDAWASARGLSRGKAIILLLDLVTAGTGSIGTRVTTDSLRAEEEKLSAELAGEPPSNPKPLDAAPAEPVLRSPKGKAAALAAARGLLATAGVDVGRNLEKQDNWSDDE